MKNFTTLAAVVMFLFAGLALPITASSFELMTATETVVVGEIEIEIVKTADNFIVLFDASSSMGETYKDTGRTKIELEKAIMKIRNAALPDLSFKAGLYTFTPGAMSMSKTALTPYYEMNNYDKVEFDKAIEKLPTKASGPTLLQDGLTELDKILSKLSGRTVVAVVTDGRYSQWDYKKDPIEIAKGLASKHDVCFYVISSVPGEQDPKFLEAINSINACSRVITFDQYIDNPLMLSGALFVMDAKLVEKSIDIEKIIGAELSHLLFAFNKADINPEYAEGLDILGTYMKNNPKAKLGIFGFTDSTGDHGYNLDLSRRRAESVAMYLVENFGIERTRIGAEGYGEADPVASNDTAKGRQQNRRVEGFVFGLE